MAEQQELLAPQTSVALVKPTPMTMLQIAVQRGDDLDKLAKLMDLQERWEANEARKAFIAALSAFKANAPKLEKNKTVSFTTAKGKTEYKHATLDNVALVLGQALSQNGLSFRWNVEQLSGKVRVTCILQHSLGHSESVAMEAPADDSGNKNQIQQVGSTVTYLERYTLLAITGTATADQDTDGAAINGEFAEYVEWIENSADMKELQKFYLLAYKAAQKAKNQVAMSAIVAAKNKRAGELQ